MADASAAGSGSGSREEHQDGDARVLLALVGEEGAFKLSPLVIDAWEHEPGQEPGEGMDYDWEHSRFVQQRLGLTLRPCALQLTQAGPAGEEEPSVVAAAMIASASPAGGNLAFLPAAPTAPAVIVQVAGRCAVRASVPDVLKMLVDACTASTPPAPVLVMTATCVRQPARGRGAASAGVPAGTEAPREPAGCQGRPGHGTGHGAGGGGGGARLARNAGWVPEMMYYIDEHTGNGTDGAGGARHKRAFLQWARVGPAALGGPFLHDHVNRVDHAMRGAGGAPRVLLPHEASLDAAAGTAALNAVRGMVFHTSRCGSTLLANALRNAGHSVVSEPEALNHTLLRHLSERDNAAGATAPGGSAGGAQPPAAAVSYAPTPLPKLVAALCRSTPPTTVFKFSSWNVLAGAELLRIKRGLPWVFLYRNPLEIAVSEFKHGSGWLRLGRQSPKLMARVFGWNSKCAAFAARRDVNLLALVQRSYLNAALELLAASASGAGGGGGGGADRGGQGAPATPGPGPGSTPGPGWVLNYADLVSPATGPAILRRLAVMFGQEGLDVEVEAMAQAMLTYSKDTSVGPADGSGGADGAEGTPTWTQRDDSDEKLREADAVPGLKVVVDELCMPLYAALQEHSCRMRG